MKGKLPGERDKRYLAPDCPHNSKVGCQMTNRQCERCGWSPAGEKRRKRKTQEKYGRKADE